MVSNKKTMDNHENIQPALQLKLHLHPRARDNPPCMSEKYIWGSKVRLSNKIITGVALLS